GDQVADPGRGLLAHRRRARPLQQHLPVRVAGDPHGQPPHEAEVDVGSDLHAELPDIEVERLILVENVAAVMRDTSEHAAEPTCAPARGASPKLLRCRDAPLASPFSPVRAYDIILSGAGVRPRPARDNGPPATVPPSAGHRGGAALGLDERPQLPPRPGVDDLV